MLEKTKGLGALVYQPMSTGITCLFRKLLQMDPIHSMGYGRTSAANGKFFYVLITANYWNGASAVVNHILN